MDQKNHTEQTIHCEILIPAKRSDVWQAWTTENGAKTFFAPACKIELKPGGAYEMLFNMDAQPGDQGGEGMLVLAVQSEHMLSFTWNSPPNLTTVRGEMTHVVVRFTKESEGQTRVTLEHDGWGAGGEWDQAFQYFTQAWGEVVLPRLKYSFEVGPIDWENPPTFAENKSEAA